MTTSTILITGLSGFIAKHCAIELLRHGYAVRGTLRSMGKADAVRATLARHGDSSRLAFCQADLTADAGWAEAMDGVAGVLHMASPFPLRDPRDADELLRPAVDGTLRVLRAARAARIARVVQTSSVAAVAYGHPGQGPRRVTEDDWTDADAPGVSIYERSKTLAERAARDFVAADGAGLHFATVNPGLVVGPVLDRDIGATAELIQMFLRGKYPGVPRLWYGVVDVRDVARMHRLALETPAPSGGRYLAVSETARLLDVALAIRARLGAAARKAPRRQLPDAVVRLVALFDPAVRTVLPELGYQFEIDNSHTRRALGVDFIPLSESAPAMASSLIELGLA